MSKYRESAYSAKLRDPRWQRMRLQVLERDGWKCRSCGREDATLHAHHSYYERGCDPWEYDPSIIVTLCEECHEGEHANWECDGIREALSANGFWSVYARGVLAGALRGNAGERPLGDDEAQDLVRVIESFCASVRGDGQAAGEMMRATVVDK